MTTIPLKEDGSLDIERINNLPQEEFINVIASFTKEQSEEYYSKLPDNGADQPIEPLSVDSVEEFLKKGGWVSAEDFLKL